MLLLLRLTSDGLALSRYVVVSDTSMLAVCRAAFEPRLSFFVSCFVAAIITESFIPSEKILPFFDCAFVPPSANGPAPPDPAAADPPLPSNYK